jgi:hypothetical protein
VPALGEVSQALVDHSTDLAGVAEYSLDLVRASTHLYHHGPTDVAQIEGRDEDAVGAEQLNAGRERHVGEPKQDGRPGQEELIADSVVVAAVG